MKNFLLTSILLTLGSALLAQDFDWAKQFGGNNYGQGLAVTTDNLGNVYTTGSVAGTVDFDPGVGVASLSEAGGGDIFISKLDASGNFVWAKLIGSIGGDIGWAIATDNTGNVYVTGSFLGTVDFDPGVGTANATSVNATDIFILKLDTDGNFVWVKTIGSADNEEGNTIKVDASNNVFISATFNNGPIDCDPGAGVFNLTGFYDSFILKLDSDGDFIWAKKFTCALDIVHIYGFDFDATGNIYTTGRFNETTNFNTGAGTDNLSPLGGIDIFVCKLDVDGNFVWVKQIGGSDDELAFGIDVDETNAIHIAGRFKSTVDFNPGTGTANLTSDGNNDIFVCKLNSSGDYVWANKFGGVDSDMAEDIVVNSNGNIYVTGAFQGVADFNPTSATNFLTTAGSYDAFCLKLNASGTFLSVMQFGGSGSDWGQSSAIDSDNNVVLTGWFEATADLNPTSTTENFTTTGTMDPYVVRLMMDDLGFENAQVNDNNILLYPNPAKYNLSVQTSETINLISIYNSTGQLVQTEIKNTFSVENLPAGIYFLQAQTENGISIVKFIKE